jgi:dTDP-4-amino-4,6-dideoxygalactose transaminase
MSKADVEPWYYEQVDLGFNYRLTDIQAALGLSQITRLKEFVSKRKMIVERYQRELAPFKGVEVIRFDDNQQPAWHLCPILLENEEQRRQVFDYLLRHDIRCQVHYLPIYWLPYYQKLGFQLGKCPKAESFYRRVLSVPVFYELSDEMQTTVIQRIKEALS